MKITVIHDGNSDDQRVDRLGFSFIILLSALSASGTNISQNINF